MDIANKLFNGDCLEILPQFPEKSVDMVLTSPPYFNTSKTYQRGTGVHYTMDIGEPLYVIQDCAKELYRVVTDEGFFCLNLGFSYGETGVMRPFYVADRIQRYGWFAIDVIIWKKSNPIPIKGRLTNSFEYIFVFAKHPKTKYPKEDIGYIHNFIETSVAKTDGDSSAPFPFDLAEFIIDIFSNIGNIVLDPFLGRGTTAKMAKQMGRRYCGIELNPRYYKKACHLVTSTAINPKYISSDPTDSPTDLLKYLKK